MFTINQEIKVFGILTTYSEWRICWLKNKDCVDAASAIKIEGDPTVSNIEEINSIPEWDVNDFEVEDSDDRAPDSTIKRHFYGSSIIPCTSSSLPLFLISVLKKMYHSPHTKVQLVDPNRSYIQLNEKSWSWVYFNKDLQLSKVNYSIIE